MASDNPGSASLTGSPPGVIAIATHYMAGVTELTAVQITESDSASPPCNGTAMVVTKSSLVAANGVCPTSWTNTSCSCISGSGREYVFNLQLKDKTQATAAVPATLDATAMTFQVSTVGQFALLDTVTTLRLIGVTTGAPINFDLDLLDPSLQTGTVQLIPAKTKNLVTEVEIANIDISGVDISGEFMPSSVTKLTLRNCNLKAPPSVYLQRRGWGVLTSMDMSGNNLTSWYGGELTSAPVDSTCTITSLNLAGNAFTSIPSAILGMGLLTSLNMSGNPVANVTVSEPLYNKIAALETFVLDSSAATIDACGEGTTSKTVHDVSLCIATTASPSSSSSGSSGSSTSSTSSKASSTSNSGLIIGGVIGGVVIVVLLIALFVMHRKRRQESRAKAFSLTVDGNSHFSSGRRGFASLPMDRTDHTLSLGSAASSLAIDSAILNDPMIITSRLDHNEIVFGEMLKQGGFGSVYSGVYRRRRVAIKKIRSEFCQDKKLVEGFLKEISLVASLKHPRIVEYIGCAWDTLKNLSMVTELMARGDLRETLQDFKQRNARLSWAEHKTRIALHIAEGLQYLHNVSPKVIHRDLKSKNILVNAELDAKLTDFGISREGRFEQTHMTAGMGTSFWIAPEVLAGLRYDERADIYSFGIVLSEIDTDDYPYWNDRNVPGPGQTEEARGRTQEGQILRMVLAGEMRPYFTPECPTEIRRLADKCLEGEPSRRPSANEIVQYLKPLVREVL